jgi:hypothetical protein
VSAFLWAGSALGIVVGVLHGIDLWRRHGGAKGLYCALWALALWTLFGAYVLAFWILGAVFWLIGRAVPLRRMWAARGAP